MKVVVQKCLNSSVSVNGKLVNKIDNGLSLLVGFTEGDDKSLIDKMAKKVANLRIFEDENGVMNNSVIDVKGSILSISQFTLYGDATKGNRPSYIKALNGNLAKPLYEYFNQCLNTYVPTFAGVFGADMIISITNNGPTTILLEMHNDK
jgi:D-aminoacyl-tRNA deacylase